MKPGHTSLPTVLVAALLAFVAAGCASSGGPVPRPFPVPNEPADGRLPQNSQAAATALVATALNLRGTPYRNGGSTVEGFDCSGFTQFVFARHGVRLPREVRDQYQTGSAVRREDASPGDLLFFATTSSGASHVGIMIGPDEFVHAPSSRGVVRVERASLRYWDQRFLGVRRLPIRERD